MLEKNWIDTKRHLVLELVQWNDVELEEDISTSEKDHNTDEDLGKTTKGAQLVTEDTATASKNIVSNSESSSANTARSTDKLQTEVESTSTESSHTKTEMPAEGDSPTTQSRYARSGEAPQWRYHPVKVNREVDAICGVGYTGQAITYKCTR